MAEFYDNHRARATVFLSGSLALRKLDPLFTAKLDDVIAKNCRILLGDANGTDKAVQKYLMEHDHWDVVVYRSWTTINNLGKWPEQFVKVDAQDRNFGFNDRKGEAMARAADCGLMLWDGANRLTVNHARLLLDGGKPVLLFHAQQKLFVRMEQLADLGRFLQAHEAEARKQAPRLARRMGKALTDYRNTTTARSEAGD